MAKSTFWGNEQLDDAKYAVYLKKVRYVAPVVETNGDVHAKEPLVSHFSILVSFHLMFFIIFSTQITTPLIQTV